MAYAELSTSEKQRGRNVSVWITFWVDLKLKRLLVEDSWKLTDNSKTLWNRSQNSLTGTLGEEAFNRFSSFPTLKVFLKTLLTPSIWRLPASNVKFPFTVLEILGPSLTEVSQNSVWLLRTQRRWKKFPSCYNYLSSPHSNGLKVFYNFPPFFHKPNWKSGCRIKERKTNNALKLQAQKLSVGFW